MYYKLIITILFVSIVLFISSIVKPIEVSEIIWRIFLYIAFGYNILYCYRLETGSGKVIWPGELFVKMLTKGPVVIFIKAGLFLILSLIVIGQISVAIR